MSTAYTIPDLARELGITTHAVRFYEEQGLLFPGRRGQEHIYSSRDKASLKLILRGKHIGFSLAECHELVEPYDPDPNGGNQEQLNTTLERIVERRTQPEQQLLGIEQMQLGLDTAEEHCRVTLTKSYSKQTIVT